MKTNLQRPEVLAILAALVFLAACAPGRAIVRGNWPDGRIQQPVRVRAMTVAPDAAVDRADTDTGGEEWVPADGDRTGLSAAELNRRGVLQTIHFDFDESNIRPDQRPIMRANAEWLLEHPDVRIIVEGHCDERGTRQYNLALGSRRAESAARHLIDLGVAPSRIETVSYGEELPVDPGHNEQAWAENRRAEFVILSTDTTD